MSLAFELGMAAYDTEREPLIEEVERLQHALNEEKERTLRLRADFENLKRRAARELETALRAGSGAALLALLPVLDALERALAAGSSDDEFYEGVASTHRLFMDALREAGARPLEALDRPFDPNCHEAVATTPSGDAPPGTVVRQVRRGWWLGEALLRPAQVIVAAEKEP